MSISPFGLPANYTNNSLYQQYIMMLLLNMQKQAQQQQLFKAQAQQAQFAQEQAREEALAAQYAQQQAQNAAANQTAYAQVNPNQVPQTAQQIQSAQQQNIQTSAQTQGIAPAQTAAQIQATAEAEVDDGKISGKEKCKNFFKGVGNFFKGMVCDENGKFSWKRTLTTVAVAAGAVALTVATGGAATPFLVAAGATMGAVQVGKGAYKAATAKTDAEAAAAWQEIGSGTTAVIGSVAGAKGALKAAGKPVPQGNAVTSSLKATGECFKISGKGIAAAGKGMAHPFQSARAIRGYWNNTAKPNLEQAFSYKNGLKNYQKAAEQRINKNIQDIDAKINALKAEQAKNPTSARMSEIDSQIRTLELQKSRLNTEFAVNTISNPKQLRNTLNAYEQKFKQYIEYQKKLPATEEGKAYLNQIIKENNLFVKNVKANLKMQEAQFNANKAAKLLEQYKADLKAATTDAQKAAIQKAIAKTESILAQNKSILRNSNYKIAAQQTLPNVGLAYGTAYLANPAPQLEGSIDDATAQVLGFTSAAEMEQYAQMNGFSNAAQMLEYLQTMQNSQQALDNADAFLNSQGNNPAAGQQYTANAASQYATNPYTTAKLYSSTFSGQMPADSGLGFNELYVSPYPEMVF